MTRMGMLRMSTRSPSMRDWGRLRRPDARDLEGERFGLLSSDANLQNRHRSEKRVGFSHNGRITLLASLSNKPPGRQGPNPRFI